jgi:hypothetical protein
MNAAYIDQDGRTANVSDAVKAAVSALNASVENASKVGEVDLFGEVITEESARAALQANLRSIGRGLIRIADAMSTIYLMNPHTGTVQTADEWAADGYTTANADLIEVTKDEKGDWIEA